MKRISTLFLKIVLGLIGIGVLAGLIYFPQTEGRAKDLDLLSIYLDPVIIYVYVASIPFFIAVYQAFTLLTNIQHNQAVSKNSTTALRNIKYCAIAIIGFILGAQVFLMFSGEEDKTGPIALGIYITFITGIVIAVVDTFGIVLHNARTLPSKK